MDFAFFQEIFMPIGWNFPNNNHGTINGIGDAGIETFKGALYKSLAREICQNSLDARLDEGKPVVVEFQLTDELRTRIPDYTQLWEAIRKCNRFWTEQGNQRAMDFFSRADECTRLPLVSILRISDHNTTGLTGSRDSINTPWQNLVKASGVSGKDGSAGGSFGIGKSAPFACSEVRAIFYATLDKYGLKAFQGVARLASSPVVESSDLYTTGVGYYGDIEKNTALEECRSLTQGYTRKDSGTDLFVLAFIKKKNWENEIIKAVLDDFLVAVFNEDLVVYVNKTCISKHTLQGLLERIKEECPDIYNNYLVMTKPTYQENLDFENMGKISLRVLMGKNLRRKVMICRKNGMRIYDQKKISTIIDFAGICILEDEKVNEYFRKMENPQHTRWEPDRHTDKDAALKFKALKDLIRNYILDKGARATVDETDAEGVGEYLADFDESFSNNEEKSEQVSDQNMDIELFDSPTKSMQKGFERMPGDGTSFEEGLGDIEDYTGGEDGEKDYHDDDPNKTHEGNSFGKNDGPGQGSGGLSGSGEIRETGSRNGDSDQMMKTTYNVRMMSIRMMELNSAKNEYLLIFTPEKVSGKAFLQLQLSGEQPGKIPLRVVKAKNKETGENLLCNGDRILFDTIVPQKKYKIEFSIDYAEKCSMEVNLYGYTR